MLCVVEQARMIFPKFSLYAVFFFVRGSEATRRGSLSLQLVRTLSHEPLFTLSEPLAFFSSPACLRPVFPAPASLRQNRGVNAVSLFRRGIVIGFRTGNGLCFMTAALAGAGRCVASLCRNRDRS